MTRPPFARRITAAVLFSLLAQSIALPAWSQQPADDPVTTQARARFKEGVEAFDKGKFEDARLAFLQAYTLKKHPAVLINLAQSSAKANHPLEAAGYFKQFLKESKDASPQQKADAQKGLEEVRTKLGRIDVVAPAGTEITVDDQKVGPTPMDAVDVEPGNHTVKAGTQTLTVTAVVGQKVKADFSPAAPPVAPAKPEPKPVDTPPEQPPPPPPKKDSGLTTPPDPMWPVYAGLGVGGVGLVGAIVFAVFKASAQSKADEVAQDIRTKAVSYGIPAQGACNNPSPTIQNNFANACNTLRSNNDNVDTDATIANVSLVVMGVGFVGAGLYFLLGPKPEAPKPEAPKSATKLEMPKLMPWVGWQSGGLSIGGNL